MNAGAMPKRQRMPMIAIRYYASRPFGMSLLNERLARGARTNRLGGGLLAYGTLGHNKTPYPELSGDHQCLSRTPLSAMASFTCMTRMAFNSLQFLASCTAIQNLP